MRLGSDCNVTKVTSFAWDFLSHDGGESTGRGLVIRGFGWKFDLGIRVREEGKMA